MKTMIQYQNLDLELDKLNKQKENLEELKVIERMRNIVKNAQNNSLKLENDAVSLLKEYDNLKSTYNKQSKEIEKLTSADVSKMSREDINNTLMSINAISSELFMIERNLNICINNISKALRDFENNKKTAIVARTKHKEAKDEYTRKLNLLEPKIEKINQELKELEGSLNKELFAKYKAYKVDGIFPVFAKLQNDACGYCRMEIAKNKLDNLKNDNFIICEHCRKIIYR